MSNELYQYVIYEHPKDKPDKFVVRKWTIYPGEAIPSASLYSEADTLEDARSSLPYGLNKMPVFPDDDPVIAEVWM